MCVCCVYVGMCATVCVYIYGVKITLCRPSPLPSSFYLSIPECELMFPDLPGEHIYLQSHLTIPSFKQYSSRCKSSPSCQAIGEHSSLLQKDIRNGEFCLSFLLDLRV